MDTGAKGGLKAMADAPDTGTEGSITPPGPSGLDPPAGAHVPAKRKEPKRPVGSADLTAALTRAERIVTSAGSILAQFHRALRDDVAAVRDDGVTQRERNRKDFDVVQHALIALVKLRPTIGSLETELAEIRETLDGIRGTLTVIAFMGFLVLVGVLYLVLR